MHDYFYWDAISSTGSVIYAMAHMYTFYDPFLTIMITKNDNYNTCQFTLYFSLYDTLFTLAAIIVNIGLIFPSKYAIILVVYIV